MKIDEIKPKGQIEIVIENTSGDIETRVFNNTVLANGRNALANVLANQIGDSFTFYIDRMLYGSNGTSGGVPKYVSTSRTGLFGATVASKPIVATIDPVITSQVTFTSVLSFDDANTTLNEIALRMNNEDLYSMATFPDLNKTNSVQITFNWRISFV
jgi:hypothetical protein|tara:strand:+ start:358 stop:828 length:471 start_codon:yes stop_codon:yes gene_type:complete